MIQLRLQVFVLDVLAMMCVSTLSLVMLSFSSPYSHYSAKLLSLVTSNLFLSGQLEIIGEPFHRFLVVFIVAFCFLRNGSEDFSHTKEGLFAVSGRPYLQML